MNTASALRDWAAGRAWISTPAALESFFAAAQIRLAAGDAHGPDAGEDEAPLDVRDGVAIVPILGEMMDAPSAVEQFIAEFFGLTTYQGISARIRAARTRPDVRAAVLELDTPGGTAAGVEATGQEVAALAAEKPTVAFVRGQASSGGYWLATSAPRIVAGGKTALVGSIGVVATILDPREALTRAGVAVHEFVSGHAPHKRTDPATTAGRQDIQGRMDEMEAMFLDHVAAGRNVSVSRVLDDYGAGAELFAPEALSVGMIDAIAPRDSVLAELAQCGRAAHLARPFAPTTPAYRPAARAAVRSSNRPASPAPGR